MDTQKTVRKYLWYDLIANLCFGLVTMINSLSSIIKTDALKTIVSTAGLINVIIFVVFTIKGRRLVSKYYDNELNQMSDDYMRYNLIFTTITLLFMFFQITNLNIRFEILFTLTMILEFGFIFNTTLEYKFLQNTKGDDNNEEQKSPQVDK